MGIFGFFSRKASKSTDNQNTVNLDADRTLKKESFPVVGTSYYTKNIMQLAERNPDWRLTAKQLLSAGKEGKRVYRYNFIHKPAKLIPEPSNQHDRNAVKAVIAGEHVGYISMDDNKKVLEILKRREIKYISAFISGGEYKVLSSDGTVEKMDSSINITMSIGYV